MFYIPFDFYQISYGVTTCVLVVLVMGIFARRQIVRLRVNSARNKPNVNLPFSKKARNGIDLQLERVENLRLSYQPRFTECTTICQHNNTPYVNRMIAIDEVALEIDGLMAKLGNERQPAEKTVDYLTRLRVKFPALPASLCYRIAYLHEAARLGPQKFDVEQRMELRSLINQFVKLVGKGDFNIEQPPPSKNIVSSLYHKLNPSSSQRRNRHKFGGSDETDSDIEEVSGGRLLAGTVAEEQERRQNVLHPCILKGKSQAMTSIQQQSSSVSREIEILNSTSNTNPSTFIKKSTSTSFSGLRPVLMSVSSTSAPTTSAKPELLKVVNNVWAGVREMLGINQLNCANGGERMAGGKCKCPRLFEGPTCERKVCLNDGELMKTKVGPVAYECKCPNPLYIDGPHCETVRCAHKALLVKSNDTWSCDCSSRIFYTGKFCENFTAPYSVLAVPIAFLIIFLLCCALCRIDWCPRKRRSQQITQARHGERRRPNPRSVQQPCRYNDRRTNLHQAQEFLLPSERQRLGLSHLARSSAPYPPPGGPPYIIRLDTIPTFNPNMIGGVDSDSVAKHIDPPPSYDQALLAPGPPEPPMYSENSDGNTSNQSNASPNRHTTSSSTRPTTNDSSNG